MAERLISSRWIHGLAYFGLTGVIILVLILPTELGPDRFPGPDLLLCITFAWVLRRPQYVPTPLIALVFLAADLLFMRPPGLWTALVVIAVEFLRAREATSRELPFTAEWAMVTVVLAAMTLANRLILAIFVVPQTGLVLTVVQLAATIATYPVIVLLSHLLFGVRRLTPGALDDRGRRL